MPKPFTQENFLLELKERNIKVFNKVISVVSYEGKHVTLVTSYGLIRALKQELFKVKDLSIKSALNKQEFWINRNKFLRKDFNNIDYSSCNYKNNSEKVDLTCKLHNYNYKQSPNHHIKGIQGCVYCMKQTIKYSKENVITHKNFIQKIDGILYVVKLQNLKESFYKVGIVSKHRFKYRINQFKQNFRVDILYEESNNMVYLFELEQKILKEFNNFCYIPKTKFIGYTECLTVNPIEYYYNN